MPAATTPPPVTPQGAGPAPDGVAPAPPAHQPLDQPAAPVAGVVPPLPAALLPPGSPAADGPSVTPGPVAHDDGGSNGVPTSNGHVFPADQAWRQSGNGNGNGDANGNGNGNGVRNGSPAGPPAPAADADIAGRVAELGQHGAGVTSSGLRRRTPRATLAAAESAAGDAGAPIRAVEPPPFRDAAQVRDMLSQFQAGVTRAQHGLEQSANPPDPEHGEG